MSETTIDTVVAWVYDDQAGNEQPLRALVPPGVMILLMCAEGSEDEPGIDVIARQYAKSGRVLAYKRRYKVIEELEVVDGRPVHAKRSAHHPRGEADRERSGAYRGDRPGVLYPL